jgi:hypothetical protein
MSIFMFMFVFIFMFTFKTMIMNMNMFMDTDMDTDMDTNLARTPDPLEEKTQANLNKHRRITCYCPFTTTFSKF